MTSGLKDGDFKEREIAYKVNVVNWTIEEVKVCYFSDKFVRRGCGRRTQRIGSVESYFQTKEEASDFFLKRIDEVISRLLAYRQSTIEFTKGIK